jgi:hypothetical protein
METSAKLTASSRRKPAPSSFLPVFPDREASGRFAKGSRHNPNGRPKGSRNKATLAALELLEGDAQALTRAAIRKAAQGDVIALRLCLQRILPAARDRTISLDIPAIKTAKHLLQAHDVIISAVAGGEISPLEAQTISYLIEARRRLHETIHLEDRVSQLESRVIGNIGG